MLRSILAHVPAFWVVLVMGTWCGARFSTSAGKALIGVAWCFNVMPLLGDAVMVDRIRRGLLNRTVRVDWEAQLPLAGSYFWYFNWSIYGTVVALVIIHLVTVRNEGLRNTLKIAPLLVLLGIIAVFNLFIGWSLSQWPL